jgi:hypothetical protein
VGRARRRRAMWIRDSRCVRSFEMVGGGVEGEEGRDEAFVIMVAGEASVTVVDADISTGV